MATKKEEREALQKIIKIIESLGEDSYLSFAFDGALEDAERNIDEDAAYSYKSRYESLINRYESVVKENCKLSEENRELRNKSSDINTYAVYLDDGETVYKARLHAKNVKEIIDCATGLGEIVAIKQIV